MSYQLITGETTLENGDVIRRTLENGNYDYFQVVGIYEEPDIYELTIPGNDSLVEIVGVLPFCSKTNMIDLGYEKEINDKCTTINNE
jgi:hypothetical protein